MTRSGRPLRFLGTTVVGWTAVRAAILWSGAAIVASDPIGAPMHMPEASAQIAARVVTPSDGDCCRMWPDRREPPAVRWAASLRPEAFRPMPVHYSHDVMALALAGLLNFGEAQATDAPAPTLVAPPIEAPIHLKAPHSATRWSASAWLIARAGRAAGKSFGGGQLGGSQAGARIAYTLDRRHRIAAVLRIATPLSGAGREVAVGAEWQPIARLPVRIVAEERVSLDGGNSGPGIGMIGGIDPTPIALGFRLEAYGQAGVIDRHRPEGFADGAARIAHPVATIGTIKLDLGGGAWGGAQRDAARLDVGPSLGAVVPIARVPVRINLDCGIMYQMHQPDYRRPHLRYV